MSEGRRERLAWAAVASIGAGAILAPELEALRPDPLELAAGSELVVTSSGDAGPGSLRQAIYASYGLPGTVRIRLAAAEVRLGAPLPPLVRQQAVVLAGRGTLIDASAVVGGPALDVTSADALITGVSVKGASRQGLLVRGGRLRLRDASFSECAEGVRLEPDVESATVEDSSFSGNEVGVAVTGGSAAVTLRGSRFADHTRAAIWAVVRDPLERGPEPALRIEGNSFLGDSQSIVVINVAAEVARNEVVGAREFAIFASGPDLSLRANKVRAGARYGIFAASAAGVLVADNEVDRQQAVAILLRDSEDARVSGNRVFENTYGLVVVFGDDTRPATLAGNLALRQREDGIYVVGASPVLRDNRAIGNGRAGLRIDDYVASSGAVRRADPLLRDNVLEGNAADSPVRGRYLDVASGGEPAR